MSEFLQSRAKSCAEPAITPSTSSPAAATERYIGITNDLRTRLERHRSGRGSEFVKYGVHRLVHVETFASPQEAIAREEQSKNWHRN
jgi:predicted GIY-YIG superfamily endonuclease